MLTPKQQAFADYYIKLGNASEAAKKAGYSERTAGATASRLLKNVNVSAYIDERMTGQSRELVASADEVLQFYTSVMRGEVKDAFGLDPGLSERLKAGDALMKRYAAGQERQQATMEKLDTLLTEMRNAAVMDT